jgi:hypothetical protein
LAFYATFENLLKMGKIILKYKEYKDFRPDNHFMYSINFKPIIGIFTKSFGIFDRLGVKGLGSFLAGTRIMENKRRVFSRCGPGGYLLFQILYSHYRICLCSTFTSIFQL